MIKNAICALLFALLAKTIWGNEGPKLGQSYCIFNPNQSVNYSANHHGSIRLVEGGHLVFMFGVKRNTKLDESETRYIVEIDSGCTSFSTEVTGKCHPILYKWNFGEGATASIDTGKVEGTKILDSTWSIHEWISSEFRSQFSMMPYRIQKKDKRKKAGMKRVCKEYLGILW